MVLRVSVPVLSEHRSVMPAISSIAVRRVTMAPCCASCRDPSASVVVLHAMPTSVISSGRSIQNRLTGAATLKPPLLKHATQRGQA